MINHSFLLPIKRVVFVSAACALIALTLPAVHAAKRDLSPFAGKYTGTTTIITASDQLFGPASIRFKPKSSKRGADVSVIGSVNTGVVLPLNNGYNLRGNGKAMVSLIGPPFALTPSFDGKFKARKKKITASCPFNSMGQPGFVRLTIKRRATKNKAFLEVKHEAVVGIPVITYIYKGDRRIKRK